MSETLERAGELFQNGEPHGAIDLLSAAAGQCGPAELDVALRDLRLRVAETPRTGGGPPDWPPSQPDPRPDIRGELVATDVTELTAELLGGALVHHGALRVDQLLDEDQVDRTLTALRRAYAAQADRTDGPWYDPIPFEDPSKKRLREIVRRRGGLWLADSPTAMRIVLDELRHSGVADVIASHLGERPFVSLEKSTLRITPPEDGITGWHQDGSFLGDGVRTVNVWIALSHCGGDVPASGLELVPHRMDELLPRDPALNNAGIPFDLMDELLVDHPSIQPEFCPGDAVLFDERLLHRTALGPHLNRERFALESWFFAPTAFTGDYTPLVV